MSKDTRYSNYTQLLKKVDEAFVSIVSNQPQMFNCGPRCHSCCKSGLSVLGVEASYILNWLQENETVKVQIANEDSMMNKPEFCVFLDKKGMCAIYNARPIICRSHGAPIAWLEDDTVDDTPQSRRDVCPLNFIGEDIYQLPEQDTLSIEKINTLLSLINRHFTQSDSAERIELSDLLADLKSTN
jgi:uncharacterized protein